jgi:hypothetical protein
MIMEALEGMRRCSECGVMYEEGEGHSCSMEEAELDEFSGAGAVAGYTLPLGMRPPGPRRDITNVARRSFGGLGKGKRKKR